MIDRMYDIPNTLTDYAKISEIVRSGQAPSVFKIGDTIPCALQLNNTNYEYVWRIVDFSDVQVEDRGTVPGMTLFGEYAVTQMSPGSELFDRSAIRSYLNSTFSSGLPEAFVEAVGAVWLMNSAKAGTSTCYAKFFTPSLKNLGYPEDTSVAPSSGDVWGYFEAQMGTRTRPALPNVSLTNVGKYWTRSGNQWNLTRLYYQWDYSFSSGAYDGTHYSVGTFVDYPVVPACVIC